MENFCYEEGVKVKLRTFRVREFRSVWDSGDVAVEDCQTCLVGKNESGKKALIEALYKTNPVVNAHIGFDPVVEYPKNEAADYTDGIEAGTREHSIVVRCNYEIEPADLSCIENVFGTGVVRSRFLIHDTFYDKSVDDDRQEQQRFRLELAESRAMLYLIEKLNLDPDKRVEAKRAMSSWSDLHDFVLSMHEQGHLDHSDEIVEVLSHINNKGFFEYVVVDLLWPHAPKFMYFDEYYQMRGGENLQALTEREEQNQLQNSDLPLLGFIRLARTDPQKLLNPRTTEELRNRLVGASRQITRNIVRYWSQNRHLEVEFQVLPGRPEDPVGMRDAQANIWAMVRDNVHGSLTEIDKRSRGFVWFFSFLAWYGHIRREHGSNIVLLLDEPGLSLHGKAQHDLLRYFAEELSDHQVIYTTHSPFMLDIEHKKRIRVVQDKGIDAAEELPREYDGTKVINRLEDVWTSANTDTLFPLLTAMGIEMWQMDLVGKNRLIVEGPSDRDYIDTISRLLEREGRDGLSRRRVVIQAGGRGKISPIVSILNSQRALNVAVLLDVDTENDGKIEELYKKKLIQQKSIHRVADFTDGEIADIEDMFDREFYVKLVNESYSDRLADNGLSISELAEHPRVVKGVEKVWKERGKKSSAMLGQPDFCVAC